MTTSRPVIDVSPLPGSALDHRSLIWWGNLLLIFIETTMFALLVAAYFYLRPKFNEWPPPLPSGPFAIYDPVPALGLPTINLILIMLTLVPMIVADRAALKINHRVTTIALVVFLGIGLTCIALRFGEFSALKFRWDDNAYGSVTWTLVGLHLLHLIVGVLEIIVLLTWILVHGLDDKHARDVRVTAVYWYWVVGTWIILFAIIFPGPRFF